jgi:large subunit ribosomal protein L22
MARTYEETGLVRAQAKWVRSSARKARIVLDNIRGLSAAEARNVLTFTTRDVARDINKVLASAVANAVNNHGLDEDALVIHEAFADEGVTIKRFKPRARGRADRIRKRTSHITILLRAVETTVVVETAPEPVVEEKPKRKRAAAKKAETAPAAEAVAETTATVADEAPAAEVVAEEPAVAAAPAAEAPDAAAEVSEPTVDAEAPAAGDEAAKPEDEEA